MPDNKVNVIISGTDDLSPKINAATDALSGMEAEIEKLGSSFHKMGESQRLAGGGEESGFKKLFSEQSKELMAGIGYNIGLWNVGMMASQAILNAVTKAFQDFVAELQLAIQWQNRLDQSNIQATQSFNQLREAAFLSGTALTDTAKRVQEFTSLGMGLPQAITTTQTVQQRLKETGIDVTDVIKKAQTLSATAQDVMKAGEAGGPFAFLKPQAEELARMEAMRPYEELQMQRRQLAGEREFQDTTRIIERESEERHRAINYEMEDRFRAINREMELRHLAIEQEMADRHRMAEQAAQDEDRLHSRRMGLMGGIKGLTQAAFQEFTTGQHVAAPMRGLERAQEQLRGVMKAGAEQLEKDLGLSRGTGREMAQAGLISPETLIQEAEVGRQEQRITEQRQRQVEEIETGRALQREAYRERIAQEDEQRETQRAMQAEQLAMQYAIQDAELALQRRNQDERISFEEKFAVLRYKLNKSVLDADARDEEQRRIKESVLHGGPGQPGLERAGEMLPFPLNLLFTGQMRANMGPELIGKEPGPEKDLNDSIKTLDQGFEDGISKDKENIDSTKANTTAVKDLTTVYQRILQSLKSAEGGGTSGGGAARGETTMAGGRGGGGLQEPVEWTSGQAQAALIQRALAAQAKYGKGTEEGTRAYYRVFAEAEGSKWATYGSQGQQLTGLMPWQTTPGAWGIGPRGTPAPGQKPEMAGKAEDKPTSSGFATEGTLKKVQENLEKVFTGGGG
jgi:hypothetical protein